MESTGKSFNDIFIKDTWKNEGKSKFLFTGYRMINFGTWENNFLFDLENMRVGLMVGEINYPHIDVEWDVGLGAPGGDIKIVEEKKNKTGGWLLFCQPYDSDNSAYIKQIQSSYCAMFMSILGRQVAYEKQFHYIHDTSTNQNIFDVGPPLSPNVLVKLNLSDQKINLVKELASAIHAADPMVKSRLLLSLHWFEKGIRSSGTDSFLNLWIALEALAMPDTTNIKAIKIILTRIYDLKDDEDSFSIGRLFGVRSRIVHSGEIVRLDYKLGRYLEAIYTDILLFTMELDPIFKTKALVETEKFSIDAEIDKLMKRSS